MISFIRKILSLILQFGGFRKIIIQHKSNRRPTDGLLLMWSHLPIQPFHLLSLYIHALLQRTHHSHSYHLLLGMLASVSPSFFILNLPALQDAALFLALFIEMYLTILIHLVYSLPGFLLHLQSVLHSSRLSCVFSNNFMLIFSKLYI